MDVEKYKDILEQIKLALTELARADFLFAHIEGRYSTHPFAKTISKLEESIHVMTHEYGSSIALTLEDVQRQLTGLQLMLEFPEFSETEFEMVECEMWSLELVRKIHATMSQREKVSLEGVSKLVKELQGKLETKNQSK